MTKEITLTTRKQLDIYMNPQRQRLLKQLGISAKPMNSKQLSEILEISASSVSHHIKKLETIGVIGLDHTESIHGIQAKYYKRLPVMVNLGSDREDDFKEERSLLSDYFFSGIWNDFKNHMNHSNNKSDFLEAGDAMNGIIYVTDEEARRLKGLLLEFYATHLEPGEGTVPWETAVMAFPHRTDGD